MIGPKSRGGERNRMEEDKYIKGKRIANKNEKLIFYLIK
jgi:hypothetical protein